MFRLLRFKLLFAFLLIPMLAFAASPLEDELANDPLGRGYSTMTDEEIYDSGWVKNRNRSRTSMTGREVGAEVVSSEYNSLQSTKKTQFLELIASEDLDPYGLAETVVIDIFGSGSTTVSNLAAARVEVIGRWNELGISPKVGEIEDARP